MYCHVNVSRDHLDKLAAALGLNEGIRYTDIKTRLIVVPDDRDPAEASFRNKYEKHIQIQQWVPTRYGFGSAILFYNRTTGKGCLYLSLAFS